MDTALAAELTMQETPAILFLPSGLAPFAKFTPLHMGKENTDQILCLNPGRLAKGSALGTFMTMQVCPTPGYCPSNSWPTIAVSLALQEFIMPDHCLRADKCTQIIQHWPCRWDPAAEKLGQLRERAAQAALLLQTLTSGSQSASSACKGRSSVADTDVSLQVFIEGVLTSSSQVDVHSTRLGNVIQLEVSIAGRHQPPFSSGGKIALRGWAGAMQLVSPTKWYNT